MARDNACVEVLRTLGVVFILAEQCELKYVGR